MVKHSIFVVSSNKEIKGYNKNNEISYCILLKRSIPLSFYYPCNFVFEIVRNRGIPLLDSLTFDWSLNVMYQHCVGYTILR
jgi:hypothetical protein